MLTKTVLAAVLTASAVVTPVVAASSADAATARRFSNCTALNKVYPHGVGRKGAHDHTSGVPVTSFTRNTTVYNQNTGRDRDRDGIACEKR